MMRSPWIPLIAVSLLLAGCPSLGPRDAPPSADRAAALTGQGDHAGAARIYEALAAESAGADRNDMLLRAVRSWISARQPQEAARALSALQAPFTEQHQLERALLGVEVTMARGQPQQAWQQLAAVPEPAATAAAIRYLGFKRRVALTAGRAVDAVQAQIDLERRVTNVAERRQTRLEMLLALREASESGLRIEPRASTDPVIRGWLELASLSAAAARSPGAAAPDIEAWRTRYPNHPATEVVRTELLGAAAGPVEATAHVALLLPLSGRQAAAAALVRDGFITAYYQAPASQRPLLRVYDTGGVSISEALDRATRAGADFVVGPLTREEVVAAAGIFIPRPPMLALNFLPPEHSVPQAFTQFALSPEDEARQVARRVVADGHRRGVALVPIGDWGTRVLNAFNDELTRQGGALVGSATYDASMTDYSDSITSVLRLTDSRARHRRLETVLDTRLQFEPRRRGDIAFIFAASQAANARLLRPQLRFHFAGDLPTYATSDSYEPDISANEDLDGLTFPDMPWMLGGALADGVSAAVRTAWPGLSTRRNRLFAFGFDAYRLLASLRSASAGTTIEGLTGRLSVGADGRVRRELEWAQLKGGEAILLPRTAQ
jgi:outer membrane PBP1 activator LpoA protein